MPKISDIKIGGRLFQLSVGYPGTGKTVAAASYPTPILFLDLDLRLAPLAKMFPGREDIEYESYGPNDFLRFWNKLQEIRAGNTPHKTYVLDSLTALARMTLNYSVSMRGSSGDEKRKSSFKAKGVIDLLEIEDFGAEGRLLGHVVDSFRATKKNFIMTAHLIHTTEKDIKTKTESDYKSLLTGGKKIAAEIPSYFDEIYYHFIETQMDDSMSYKISTVKRNDVFAKTALPLPPTLDYTMKPGEPGLFQKIQAACKANGVEIG